MRDCDEYTRYSGVENILVVAKLLNFPLGVFARWRTTYRADISIRMTNVHAEEYLNDRLEAEIAWYDKKSEINKKCNTVGKSVEIICAALVPFFAGYAKEGAPYVSVLIGILGVAVAASAGISALLKFQEQWIKY